METLVTVKALKAFEYRNRSVRPGERVSMTPVDAAIAEYKQRVSTSPLPPEPEPEPEPEEPEQTKAPEPEPSEPTEPDLRGSPAEELAVPRRRTRHSRRRDITPEP